MATRKKRLIDFSKSLDEQIGLVEEKDLKVWSNDASDLAPYIPPDSQIAKKSPAHQKAFLRILANQSMTGKSAADREKIRKAREWYGKTQLKHNINERAGVTPGGTAGGGDGGGASGGGPSSAEQESSTDGLAVAVDTAAKALAVDFGLARARGEMTPGKQVGPTKKAARTQKARKRVEKQTILEPGSVAWAKQKQAEDLAQQEILWNQSILSAKARVANAADREQPTLSPSEMTPGQQLAAKRAQSKVSKYKSPGAPQTFEDIGAAALDRPVKAAGDWLAGKFTSTPSGPQAKPLSTWLKPSPKPKKTTDLSKKRKNKNGTYSPGR